MAAPSLGLSPHQLRSFAEKGYVVVRPDERGGGAAALARLRDAFWAGAPAASGCSRDDPASWPWVPGRDGSHRDTLGLVPDEHPWLRDALVDHPFVRAAASQLLGPQGEPRDDRVSGPFVIRPFGEPGRRQTIRIDQPHIDAENFHLGVFLYAADVAAGGGGFTVWEESHRRLWLANPECTGSGHYNAEGGQAQRHGRGYHRVRELLLASGDSAVELTGPAGTLVFWHHRLAHAAGANTEGQVRLALRADYRIKLDATAPPAEDMWTAWGPALRAVCGEGCAAKAVVPPSERVRVSAVLSEQGPLAYFMDWRLAPLAQREFDATATADDVRRWALSLLPPLGVGEGQAEQAQLSFEYPPRPWPSEAGRAEEPDALAWMCDGPGGYPSPLPPAGEGLGWLTLGAMRLGAEVELRVQLPEGAPWPRAVAEEPTWGVGRGRARL